MTLGAPSTGKASIEAEFVTWTGEQPPRDEFFWISQINKCSMILNTRQGLLDAKKVKKWARALSEVIAEGSQPGAHRPKMVIHYEPKLIEKADIGITAVHMGRSSQDMHSTFQKAILRDGVLAFCRALLAVRQALLKLAEDNVETIAPCYTNGVAAQPSSLGHTWLGHLAGFERDFENLRELYARLNLSPMGSTVLNGTSWPLDRTGMAEYLGFEGIVENCYDATQIASTDIPVEVSLKLISPLLHVTQFIQDVMVQYAQPHPWILVSGTYCSSAMPQKRNPGALIDVRRDANTVLGNLQSVVWRAHNLTPGMYDCKDSIVNSAFLEEATHTLNIFAEVLGMLKVDPERALEELDLDWTASQELADILMKNFGIPFRLGHKVASRMVDVARKNWYRPSTFPYAEICSIYKDLIENEKGSNFPSAFPLSEKQFREALNPREIVRNRHVTGGPQPAELMRLIQRERELLKKDADWTTSKEKILQDAEARCEADFKKLFES